ncbi:PTS system mannose/fructose/sorbose family transporter subunit IID [Clostridium felsineum]|nr:PTS system mannose/fructose/sorbose family transporter subunit IID [Clostridium felsineum]MCR3761717.1 PTS system mannose/fructose/sorbose family transporter subunit IID [Clostridium felsineum]
MYKGDKIREVLKRHLEFFSTHPFVTAPILGVITAIEI